MGDHRLICYLRYDPGTGSLAYVDVTADVLQSERVTFQRGAGDEAGGLRPASVQLRLKDLAAVAPTYDPDHPSSPLYGKAGRNTNTIVGYVIAQETFEGAGPPWAFTSSNAGTGVWATATDQAYTGLKSLKSPALANSQNSDFLVTVPTGANVVVYSYRVDAQAGDLFTVVKDPSGTPSTLTSTNSTGGVWLNAAFLVVPGQQLRFRYAKDAAGAAGADAAWIDDVTFIDAHISGEAANWQPDQNEAFVAGTPSTRGLRWTDLNAAGVLRRIGQWSDPLASPMYQQITGYGSALTGYWPGESEGQVSSAVSGVAAATTRGTVSYGNSDAPGGSEPLIQLGSDGTIIGRFRKASGSAGWQVVWSAHLNQVAASRQNIFTFTTSNGYVWAIDADATNYYFTCTNSEGVLLLNAASSFGSANANVSTNFVTFRMYGSISGGTVTFAPAWYGANDLTEWGTSYTFAGNMGYVTTFRVTGNAVTANMRIGHIYGTEGTTPDAFAGTAKPAINGFPGETVENRFKRLCAQKGITTQVTGTTGLTLPMGPQKSDVFQDLLKEMVATDACLIVDTRWQRSLTLRTRQSMYQQTPRLTLTRSQCIAPLSKAIDDKGSWNTVTATSRDGRTDVAQLVAGAMSTQNPPDGIGLYERKIEGNWSAAYRLSNISGWWLQLGTLTEPRYSSVSLDLDGAAAAIELDASLVDPGDVIVLSDVRPDPLPLLVIGIDQTQDTRRHRILTFTCIPATVHQAMNLWNAASMRYDAATTTMASAVAAGVTALPITSTNVRDAWVNPTTVDPRPVAAGGTYGQYDLIIAGERVTVTAATAPAGAGPITQTLTVVRAVNGVTKALPAGAAVQLYAPTRWAL